MKRILLFSYAFALVCSMVAQNQTNDKKTVVIHCSQFHATKPLSELATQNSVSKEKKEFSDKDKRSPQRFLHSSAEGAIYDNDPAIIQNSGGTGFGKAPIQNWDGIPSFSPPDPSGAAGPNHYVQLVNATTYTIYSKTGTSLLSGLVGGLWNPATGQGGDPILLYDKYADRWFISQIDLSNNIHIAISKTADPTGAYYTYTFNMSFFPDYPKMSVWADGYYMAANGSNSVGCFERTKMLAGDSTARMVLTTLNSPPVGFFLPLPGDADGILPPNGTPCPFVYYTDNAWGSGYADGIQIEEMQVDWTPATPTATLTAQPFIPTSAFDASYNSNWDDIPQPGTSQKLDGIGGVLMFRAQWRKWTSYNSIVVTWGIKINSSQRSLMWCELRQNGTTWSLYQEGIYTPDTHSRWMGSIAMDDNGSIALAYCKSSASIFPSLCYTGRKATDPLGQMTIAEETAIAGSGAQTYGNRYGDYAHTSLDPDGTTFWHTGEYLNGGNSATRIYSFKIPLFMGVDENINEIEYTISQLQNKINLQVSKLPSNKEIQVDLFDIEGKQLSSKLIAPISNTLETSIDVSGLASGTYLIRVGNKNFQKVVKVSLK